MSHLGYQQDFPLSIDPLKADEPLLINDSVTPTNELEVEPISMDQLLEKIGLKWYHIRLLLIIGTIAVCEGAQIIIMTLCVTLTQGDWGFGDTGRILLITFTFMGVVIGSGIAGFFADKYGRRKPMLGAVLCMTAFNLLSTLGFNIVIFTALRTLVGISLGFFAPLGFTYVVENVPKEYRAKIVMLANTCLFIGQLIACGIAFITVQNLSTGNWRAMLIVSTIPFAIGMVFCFIYLDESLRYLLVMGRFEDAFGLIHKILKVNNDPSFQALTENQRIGLQSWEHHLEEEVSNRDIASVRALFKGEFKRLTLIVWFGWFVSFFVYYGIIIFLPSTLAKISDQDPNVVDPSSNGSYDIPRLTLSVLVESVSVVIAYIAVTLKSISQRKTLIVFFLLTGLSALGMVFNISTDIFVLLATTTKIFINICTYYCYLFTLESYPTKYRATGLGLAVAVGKIATVLVPAICFTLAEVYMFAPFGLFALLAVAASVVVLGIPLDMEYRDLK